MWNLKTLRPSTEKMQSVNNFTLTKDDVFSIALIDFKFGNIHGLDEYICNFLCDNFDILYESNGKINAIFLENLCDFSRLSSDDFFESISLTCLATKKGKFISYNIGNGLLGVFNKKSSKVLLLPQDLDDCNYKNNFLDFKRGNFNNKNIGFILTNETISQIIYNNFFYNDFTDEAKNIIKKQDINQFNNILNEYNIKNNYYIMTVS